MQWLVVSRPCSGLATDHLFSTSESPLARRFLSPPVVHSTCPDESASGSQLQSPSHPVPCRDSGPLEFQKAGHLFRPRAPIARFPVPSPFALPLRSLARGCKSAPVRSHPFSRRDKPPAARNQYVVPRSLQFPATTIPYAARTTPSIRRIRKQ